MIIDYEDDKENMPNESDYEDLPSMYKDEDDDVDDEDEDEDDDDSIFTSERLQPSARSRRYCWEIFSSVYFCYDGRAQTYLYLGRRTVCLSTR